MHAMTSDRIRFRAHKLPSSPSPSPICTTVVRPLPYSTKVERHQFLPSDEDSKKNRESTHSIKCRSGAQARCSAQRRAVRRIGCCAGRRSIAWRETRRIQRWRPADGQDPHRRAHRWFARGGGGLRSDLAKGVHSAGVVINIQGVSAILGQRREPIRPTRCGFACTDRRPRPLRSTYERLNHGTNSVLD